MVPKPDAGIVCSHLIVALMVTDRYNGHHSAQVLGEPPKPRPEALSLHGLTIGFVGRYHSRK